MTGMDRRSFLYLAAAAISSTAIGSTAIGCGAGTDRDDSISEVDYLPGPDDIDPQQGQNNTGTCEYDPAALPLMIFNSIRFDPSLHETEQNMSDQRVYEGGLTLGELFESALDSETAYTAASFKVRYDAVPGVKGALYDDLSSRISEKTCETDPDGIQSVLDEMFHQLFDNGPGELNFRLRDTNAIYFSRAAGNDDVERTYMLLIGTVLPTDGNMAGDSMVLYYTPMDSTTTLLESIEGGG